jgi:uncharacterized membrane protein
LQPNDWNIRQFLVVAIILQASALALDGLSFTGFDIWLLRAVINFISIALLPGLLILRIFSLHYLGKGRTMLLALTLSIGITMFEGLILNLAGPYIGIQHPIAFGPVIIITQTVSAILLLLSYFSDKSFVVLTHDHEDRRMPCLPQILCLCLFPLMAILGPIVLNGYGNNIVQCLFLASLALFVLFSPKWLPERLLPYSVLAVSLSLLLHTVLISNYVWGADINSEIYLSQLVISQGHWNASITADANASLSTAMIGPIISIALKIPLFWVYKFFYPVMFALVPLGLFDVYSKLRNNLMAYFGALYFTITYFYYTVLPAIPREEIADLFFVCLLIILLLKGVSLQKRAALAVFCMASLIVAHYGTAYILMFILILSLMVSLICFRNETHVVQSGQKYMLVKTFSVILFIVLAVTWFMYVSSAAIFDIGVKMASSVVASLTETMRPGVSQPLSMIGASVPIITSIETYLFLVSQVFIAVGILKAILNRSLRNDEFTLLSFAAFTMAGVSLILPYVASALNSSRLFHITLFFLGLFFVDGFMYIVGIIQKPWKRLILKISQDSDLGNLIISCFLMIFLLFNSALLSQIFNEEQLGRFAIDSRTDFYRFNTLEMTSAAWLKGYFSDKYVIRADIYKDTLLSGILNNCAEIKMEEPSQFHDAYIFLGSNNINQGTLMVRKSWQSIGYVFQDEVIKGHILSIYDNGGSRVLLDNSEG